eukprot:UN03030
MIHPMMMNIILHIHYFQNRNIDKRNCYQNHQIHRHDQNRQYRMSMRMMKRMRKTVWQIDILHILLHENMQQIIQIMMMILMNHGFHKKQMTV